jgi:hypothetical protein
LEKIKHGFKTLAECGGIRGVDDTSSFLKQHLMFIGAFFSNRKQETSTFQKGPNPIM